MRKILLLFFVSMICLMLSAQSFEGILKIDYKDEAGKRSAADVYVKGDRFYIKKVFGGADRYDSYIYDSKMHTLICMTLQPPKTALKLNIDQIMDIYEQKQLRAGYKIHMAQHYVATGSTKKIGDIKTMQKKADDLKASYEVWVADQHISYIQLIPVLRITGFWGAMEDEDNTIIEGHATNKVTKATADIIVVPVKDKVEDVIFTVPAVYQLVDMDKFLVNESKSPRFGDLVKAFAGF